MAISRTIRIRSWKRPLTIASLTLLALVTIEPALAQSSRAGTGEVIAVRELQMKTGIDLAEFERFVTGRYNPSWEGAVPGLKGYIGKADRGVQKGSYALVLIFDSERTRNAIFPKEGGGASERFVPLLEKPLGLNKELDKYIEPGTLSVYTDYVILR